MRKECCVPQFQEVPKRTYAFIFPIVENYHLRMANTHTIKPQKLSLKWRKALESGAPLPSLESIYTFHLKIKYARCNFTKKNQLDIQLPEHKTKTV